MPTRIYLPSTGAAAVSPAFDAAWDETVDADRREMVTTKISSAMTTETRRDNSNKDEDHLGRQLVSKPIEAQTITAQSVKIQIRIDELAAGNNLFLTWGLRVFSNDGSTLRGTLLSVGRDGLEANAGSLENRGDDRTTSEVVAQANDRIVLEIGCGGDPTGGGNHDMDFRVGDVAGSDLPENDTATSDDNPWIEFANVITFVTSSPVSNTQASVVEAGGTPIASQATELETGGTPIASQATELETLELPIASQQTELEAVESPIASQATVLEAGGSPIASQQTELEAGGSITSAQATELETGAALTKAQATEVESIESVAAVQGSDLEQLQGISRGQGSILAAGGILATTQSTVVESLQSTSYRFQFPSADVPTDVTARHALHYFRALTASSGENLLFFVRLFSSGTQIFEDEFTADELTTTPTQIERLLTTSERSALAAAGYGDIEAELEVRHLGNDTTRNVRVHWAEMEVPRSVTPTTPVSQTQASVSESLQGISAGQGTPTGQGQRIESGQLSAVESIQPIAATLATEFEVLQGIAATVGPELEGLQEIRTSQLIDVEAPGIAVVTTTQATEVEAPGVAVVQSTQQSVVESKATRLLVAQQTVVEAPGLAVVAVVQASIVEALEASGFATQLSVVEALQEVRESRVTVTESLLGSTPVAQSQGTIIEAIQELRVAQQTELEFSAPIAQAQATEVEAGQEIDAQVVTVDESLQRIEQGQGQVVEAGDQVIASQGTAVATRQGIVASSSSITEGLQEIRATRAAETESRQGIRINSASVLEQLQGISQGQGSSTEALASRLAVQQATIVETGARATSSQASVVEFGGSVSRVQSAAVEALQGIRRGQGTGTESEVAPSFPAVQVVTAGKRIFLVTDSRTLAVIAARRDMTVIDDRDFTVVEGRRDTNAKDER